ncbi:MAG: helix-turn-helix domain-containing protein, partial [Moorea sp. SIO2B7]|nr:helix-turn-helix domain-containing protein [Moorena sp. SIO2B7]
MSYSLELRQKVIDYIESGGKITKAAKVFGIGRASIYRWLERKELEATKVKYRQRKIDREELEKDIKENPEAKLKQRAEKFGVSTTAIWAA